MALDPRITDAMWSLWTGRPVESWRLGGIAADKPHYHNTVIANQRSWPWSYSVRFALDTQRGPKDKSRAIDYTMSNSDMRKYTKRLIDAADRNDPRMRGVREFYGTLDGRTVVGRIRDNDTGEFRVATADSSHLWHIHLAAWAAYCADVVVLSGVTSILRGETLASWRVNPSLPSTGLTLREGDTGPAVEQLQQHLNEALNTGLAVDGRFGPNTTAGVKLLQRTAGIEDDGIYGPQSADALRDLLEDDMPLTSDDARKLWHTDGIITAPSDAGDRDTNPTWAPASAVRATLERVYHLPSDVRAIKAGQAAILAAVKGLDTAAVIAAIERTAKADAERDAALLTELREFASGGADADAILDRLAARLSGGE